MSGKYTQLDNEKKTEDSVQNKQGRVSAVELMNLRHSITQFLKQESIYTTSNKTTNNTANK